MTNKKNYPNKEEELLSDEKELDEEELDEDENPTEMESSELKELIGKNEVLKLQFEEAEEKYKRVLADYRNLEQRTQVERIQFIQLANRNLITALLEPLDFLHTATKHIEDKGLKMVIDRFHQVLNEQGVEEIGIKSGDKFDESLMEAVDTAKGEDGKVVEVKQKGYKLNGIVIRHAKVVVGKGK